MVRASNFNRYDLHTTYSWSFSFQLIKKMFSDYEPLDLTRTFADFK
jgi:hypothetical protein